MDLRIAQRRTEIHLVQLVSEAIGPAVLGGLVALAALAGAVLALCAFAEVAENLVQCPAAHVLLAPGSQLDAAPFCARGFPQIPLVLQLLKEIIQGVVRFGQAVLIVQGPHPFHGLIHIATGVRDHLREQLEQPLERASAVLIRAGGVKLKSEHKGQW